MISSANVPKSGTSTGGMTAARAMAASRSTIGSLPSASCSRAATRGDWKLEQGRQAAKAFQGYLASLS